MRFFATGWSDGFDGPGRRLVLYAKGCNFRCRWCANPEGLSGEPEILFYPSRAALPAKACAHGAVAGTDGHATLDRSMCAACGDRSCVEVWKHPAFEWADLVLSAEDVLERARRARPLFGRAGGVTFGGGEATLLGEELQRTLGALAAEGIDAAVESNASTPVFRALIGSGVRLICDVKCVDGARHREWTGADNDAVLENVMRAARDHERLRVRVPFVTGLNDDEEEMRRIAGYVSELCRARRAARGWNSRCCRSITWEK